MLVKLQAVTNLGSMAHNVKWHILETAQVWHGWCWVTMSLVHVFYDLNALPIRWAPHKEIRFDKQD